MICTLTLILTITIASSYSYCGVTRLSKPALKSETPLFTRDTIYAIARICYRSSICLHTNTAVARLPGVSYAFLFKELNNGEHHIIVAGFLFFN